MGRTLTSDEITLVAGELDGRLGGAALQDSRQPTPFDIYLEFRSPGRNDLLLISTSHEFSRVHLTGSRPPNPAVPFAFQSLLRARLSGERLAAVRQLGGDRVVELEFSGGHFLVAELTGRHSNMFLCEGPGRTIAASMHQTTSRRRALVQGMAYQRPFPRPSAAVEESPTDGNTMYLAPADENDPYMTGAAPFNEHLERLYAPLIQAHELELAKGRARGIAGAELKKLSRLLQNVSKDLDASVNAPEYVRLGEAIKHSLHLVRKGATEAALPEYGPDGVVELRVALKPGLSARENMERYFRLARRLSDARVRIQERRNRIEKRISILEGFAVGLDSAAAPGDVDRLLKSAGLRGSERGRAPAPDDSKGTGRRAYSEYFIKGVGRLLAGGNAEENDMLTFKVARGNDVWFHVIGFPGAHVVARMGRDEEPSQALLHAGARLAASRSKAPEGEKVEVAWTRQKHLRKPRGAKPGSVLVSQEKRLLIVAEKNPFGDSLRSVDSEE